MALTLEVISFKGLAPADPLSACFDKKGGTIGRSLDNHLSLPDQDKIISRHHGSIRYENGAFIYIDESSGGTWLCNENRLLEKDDSVTLADGDHLRIGEYQLSVRIERDDEPFPGLSSGFDAPLSFGDHAPGSVFDLNAPNFFNDHEPTPVLANYEPPLSPAIKFDSFINQPDASPFQQNFTPPGIQSIPDDFDNIFGNEPISPPPAALATDELDFFGGLLDGEWGLEPSKSSADPVLPPKPFPLPTQGQAPQTLIFPESTPDAKAENGLDIFTETPALAIDLPKPQGRPIPPPKVNSEPAPPAHPQNTAQAIPRSPATEPASGVDLFTCFLEGAGLTEFPNMSLEEQALAMKSLGEVYRYMIDGMMMALRARSEEKREIRTDVTIIRKEKNNPLKFIPTVEDAMKVMITGKYTGYIDASLAVKEGFSDILKHQMAMRAGMQAAVGEILKSFEPSGFEKPYKEGIVFQKKVKCWDAYTLAYPKLVTESMDNLFGDTFAKAYEEQMNRLRSSHD